MPEDESDLRNISSHGNNPISLLFVDDEPSLLEIATLFLERHGRFQVTPSLSAKTALLQLASQHFDAVIADYDMPDMDGIELLKQIRIQSETIPFILFTGRGREEVAIEALNHWADFYLEKGGDPKTQFSELSNKVLTAVERRKYQEELALSHEKLQEAYDNLSLREQELESHNLELIRNKQELELSERKYRELFHAMKEGVLLHQVLYESPHRAIDYRIVDGNPAVNTHMGFPLQSAIGKKASELYEMQPPPDLDIYARIADTGESVSFETYIEHLHRYFSISAFSPRKDFFATVFTDITTKKQSEEKIHEMNEVLTQAQNVAHIGSWVYDLKSDRIRLSEEVYRIFGIETDTKNMTLDKIRHCIHPDDIWKYERNLKSAIETGEYQPEVYRLMMPDRSIRYVSSMGKVDCDESGRTTRLIGVIQDITKQKEAELDLITTNNELNVKNEALAASYEEIAASEEEIRSQVEELYTIQEKLRQSEHHLTLAQRVGKTGSFEIILESGEITGSEVFFEIYGIPWISSGKVPYNLFKVCTSSFEYLNQELALLITEGKPFNNEFSIHPANNAEPRTVRSIAQLIKDRDGTPERLIGVIHDITEEKKARVYLQETKDYLENLISHANAPIITWNSALQVTECNHACEILTGLNRDEVLGKNITDLFPEDSRSDSLSLIEMMMKGERWESQQLTVK